MRSAMQIADMEGVNEYERDLLETAVLFHDSGFIYHSLNHEDKGCEIAQEILGEFEYTPEEIARICGMIMATKIPQTPNNKLEKIICDADLDYLGREDFWIIGNKLFKELVMTKVLNSEEEWNRLQVRFLGAHHFFTPSSMNMRQKKKEENLRAIEEIVNSY